MKAGNVQGGSLVGLWPNVQETVNAELKQTLCEIETDVDNLGILDALQKQNLIKKIKDTYQDLVRKPESEDFRAAAGILAYSYGRILYAGNMDHSRVFLHTSLLEILHEGKQVASDKLASYALNPSIDSLQAYMVEHFKPDTELHLPPLHDIEKLTNKLSDQQNLLLAKNLRWLGHTYQNIDGCNTPEKANKDRFEAIYGACQLILEGLCKNSNEEGISREANWELAELKYNTDRFRYSLSHPGDSLGALKTLKELEPYIVKEGSTARSCKLGAQIENIQAIALSNIRSQITNPAQRQELQNQIWVHVSKAAEISEREAFPNIFLRGMFNNNKAATALECGFKNYDEMRQWSKKAIRQAVDAGHDNFYHPSYYNTAAAIEIADGKVEDAKEYIKTGLEVCKKYLQYADVQKVALELTKKQASLG